MKNYAVIYSAEDTTAVFVTVANSEESALKTFRLNKGRNVLVYLVAPLPSSRRAYGKYDNLPNAR